MKKTLALILALALCAALFVPVMADEIPDGWTAADGARGMADVANLSIPEYFNAVINVDGEEVDVTGIPGAPSGYLPMRAVCEAAGAYVDWYAEDNEAFFTVGGLGVVVNLGTMAITCDFEPVEGYEAYLDPAGYTFLPVAFLDGVGDFKVVGTETDGVYVYDVVTVPDKTEMQKVADAVVEAAEVGAVMTLGEEDAEAFGVTAENYEEVVVLFPMMSANPSCVIVAKPAEGKMDAAKEDAKAFLDNLMNLMGNYPTSAELIRAAVTEVSPDGNHILVLVSGNNDAGVEVFQNAYPKMER